MSAHGQLDACVWQQSSEHGAIHESCQLFIAARGIAGRIEQEAAVRNIVSRPTIKKNCWSNHFFDKNGYSLRTSAYVLL